MRRCRDAASFVDEIGAAMIGAALEMKGVYRLERMPFLSTEDTLLGDPQFGFPCPWITNHPRTGVSQFCGYDLWA